MQEKMVYKAKSGWKCSVCGGPRWYRVNTDDYRCVVCKKVTKGFYDSSKAEEEAMSRISPETRRKIEYLDQKKGEILENESSYEGTKLLIIKGINRCCDVKLDVKEIEQIFFEIARRLKIDIRTSDLIKR